MSALAALPAEIAKKSPLCQSSIRSAGEWELIDQGGSGDAASRDGRGGGGWVPPGVRAGSAAPFAEVQDRVSGIVGRQKTEREANAFLDALRRQTVITTIYDKKVEAEPEL